MKLKLASIAFALCNTGSLLVYTGLAHVGVPFYIGTAMILLIDRIYGED